MVAVFAEAAERPGDVVLELTPAPFHVRKVVSFFCSHETGLPARRLWSAGVCRLAGPGNFYYTNPLPGQRPHFG